MATGLIPMSDYILVRLGESYQNIKVPSKVYETKSNGIVEKVATDLLHSHEHLVGRRVFWQEEVAGAPIDRDGVQYAFVHIDDLQGYENGK